MVEPIATPSTQTVYIVEDHELYAWGLRRMIEESADFTVAGHATGVLIAVAECQIIKPDIMLVDLHLKGESGLSLVRAMRALGERPLIAIITNYNDPSLVASCEKAGANAFMLKDEPLEKVLSKLRRMRPGRWEPFEDRFAQERLTSAVRETATEAWTTLSPREIECLKLLALDLQQVDVAEKLCISLNTLKNHRKNIYKKMGFKTKTDLVLYCREIKLQ